VVPFSLFCMLYRVSVWFRERLGPKLDPDPLDRYQTDL
jgi:hypothetical protein